MDDWQQQRQRMIAEQIQPHINDQRVIAAMAHVPRHLFVPLEVQHLAYEDRAVPIEVGQTISQPYIVALMAQALMLRPTDRVLEIGAGSGYAAAVLAHLAAHVISIERHQALAERAQQTLAACGYHAIDVIVADGSLGWHTAAPYDAISVPACAPHVPTALLDQLADGGRLVLPLGDQHNQELVRCIRRGARIERESLGAVRFVPLIGADGWREATD